MEPKYDLSFEMYFNNGYSMLRIATDVNNVARLNADDVNPISLRSVNLTAINQKSAFNIAKTMIDAEELKPDFKK
jgi:hypothetical protein